MIEINCLRYASSLPASLNLIVRWRGLLTYAARQ